MIAQPVRYSPSVETPEPDEAETNRQITETLLKISEITWKDSGHAVRSVHAKAHGLLNAELVVADDLPPHLAQGLFAKPGRYPVVMRFSTIPGDILDDSVSVPRGLAIKVIGVDGERLPGSEGDITQDFLMVNGPAFSASSAKGFLRSLKLLAGTTDRAEGLKKVLSAALRGVETVLETVGGESGTLKGLGGHPETHILGETFYSQAPLRYGDYIAKISLAPASPNLTALTDAPLNVNGVPNGLREAVKTFFAAESGVWELRAQLCTDLEAMPVEDSSKLWPEEQSPFITVATLTAAPQDPWSAANVKAIDDGMSFRPWHGITAHQPLGSIMRVRRQAYADSASFRGSHNGCPMHEPRR
ncbi:MAG: catalase [Tardiphaga sp.]|nr:catalase [Tardiphaga sp.]